MAVKINRKLIPQVFRRQLHQPPNIHYLTTRSPRLAGQLAPCWEPHGLLIGRVRDQSQIQTHT